MGRLRRVSAGREAAVPDGCSQVLQGAIIIAGHNNPALSAGAGVNPVELSIFSSRVGAVCDEMAAVLRRAAFSTNIKERLDFSCAIFDPAGHLCAQAAHIPVHLGSMAYAMRDIVDALDWAPGDVVMVNDPFMGGTHLPDVTVISPLFSGGQLAGFVATRAHHANIGAAAPGSMPVSRSLDEEGVLIPPMHLYRDGRLQAPAARLLEAIPARAGEAVPPDFLAQVSANRTGLGRLLDLVTGMGVGAYLAALEALNDYGERLAAEALREIPPGTYAFTDYMEDDGAGQRDLPVRVRIDVDSSGVLVDFAGTAAQSPGNINCPLPVVAAAVYYVFRCLMPAGTPACQGTLRGIRIAAEAGSLVNARFPAAVAAGNVETSTRIVDVLLGALAEALPGRIPAASHGSMNNVAMGSSGERGEPRWDYYETIGGGMGAGPSCDGLSAVQTHMTNTLNTPVESLEMHYPLRVTRYAMRRGSGGDGLHRGGDGLVREFEFLAPAQVSLLTERRARAPWGLAGGEAGTPGENLLNGRLLAAKTSFQVAAGDRLTLATAGGGGWGARNGAGGSRSDT